MTWTFGLVSICKRTWREDGESLTRDRTAALFECSNLGTAFTSCSHLISFHVRYGNEAPRSFLHASTTTSKSSGFRGRPSKSVHRSRSFGGRYSISIISNTSRSLFTGSASPAAPVIKEKKQN